MTNTAWHLAQNGLNPVAEIQRHDRMASHYRMAMTAMGRRRNWEKWRDLLASAVYHEESAARLRREGVR